MLYISHKQVDHAEHMRLQACYEVERTSINNLRMILRAECNGRDFTDAELDGMRRDDHRNQHAVCRNQIIIEDRGGTAPERSHLFKRSGFVANGCFVTHNGSRPAVHIYGSIGPSLGDISGREVVRYLEEIGDDVDIDLKFNSAGGCVLDASQIIEAIDARSGQTRAVVDGMCNSAASLIAMHCNPIHVAADATMLIHFSAVTTPPKGRQTAAKLAETWEAVKHIDDRIIDQYLPRWRGTLEELHTALEEELGFTGQEIVDIGLADLVTASASLVTAAQRDEVWSKEKKNPANILDRRNYSKFKYIFESWLSASQYMPYDGLSVVELAKLRKHWSTLPKISVDYLSPMYDLTERNTASMAARGILGKYKARQLQVH